MMRIASLRRAFALWICPDLGDPKPYQEAVAPITGAATPEDLLFLAVQYGDYQEVGLYAVAGRVGVHSRFFIQLKQGRGCRNEAFDRVHAWFDENWPADLEWPRHIPRPARRRAA